MLKIGPIIKKMIEFPISIIIVYIVAFRSACNIHTLLLFPYMFSSERGHDVVVTLHACQAGVCRFLFRSGIQLSKNQTINFVLRPVVKLRFSIIWSISDCEVRMSSLAYTCPRVAYRPNAPFNKLFNISGPWQMLMLKGSELTNMNFVLKFSLNPFKPEFLVKTRIVVAILDL